MSLNKKNKKNNPKGCPLVMADPLDLGHGKKKKKILILKSPLI